MKGGYLAACDVIGDGIDVSGMGWVATLIKTTRYYSTLYVILVHLFALGVNSLRDPEGIVKK